MGGGELYWGGSGHGLERYVTHRRGETHGHRDVGRLARSAARHGWVLSPAFAERLMCLTAGMSERNMAMLLRRASHGPGHLMPARLEYFAASWRRVNSA